MQMVLFALTERSQNHRITELLTFHLFILTFWLGGFYASPLKYHILGERLGLQLKKGSLGTLHFIYGRRNHWKIIYLPQMGSSLPFFFIILLPKSSLWYIDTILTRIMKNKQNISDIWDWSVTRSQESSQLWTESVILPTVMVPFFFPMQFFHISDISDSPSRLLILSAITPICWYQLFVLFHM